MLTRRVRPALDSALGRVAPRAPSGTASSSRACQGGERPLRAAISDPPTLLGPAAVVRDRRDVLYAPISMPAFMIERTASLAPNRPPDVAVDLADAVLHRAPGTSLCGKLGGERRQFSRPLEANVAGGRPRKDVALQVADGHDRVVERALDVSNPVSDVFALAATGPPPARLRLWPFLVLP